MEETYFIITFLTDDMVTTVLIKEVVYYYNFMAAVVFSIITPINRNGEVVKSGLLPFTKQEILTSVVEADLTEMDKEPMVAAVIDSITWLIGLKKLVCIRYFSAVIILHLSI